MRTLRTTLWVAFAAAVLPLALGSAPELRTRQIAPQSAAPQQAPQQVDPGAASPLPPTAGVAPSTPLAPAGATPTDNAAKTAAETATERSVPAPDVRSSSSDGKSKDSESRSLRDVDADPNSSPVRAIANAIT